MTPISWDRNIRIIGIFYAALGNLHILAISSVYFIKYQPLCERRAKCDIYFQNFYPFFKMTWLSIITPIDHQLKGTNLHKILVLYHLQLRRAIRPRCRTNILMRGNHHTRYKYLDISMSSSSRDHLRSERRPFKYLLFGVKSRQSIRVGYSNLGYLVPGSVSLPPWLHLFLRLFYYQLLWVLFPKRYFTCQTTLTLNQ